MKILSLYHVTKDCFRNKKQTQIIINSTEFEIRTPSRPYYPNIAFKLWTAFINKHSTYIPMNTLYTCEMENEI